MLRGTNKTIIQVSEEQFRNAGRHGDMLISILKEREVDIVNNKMLIRTNLSYSHPNVMIKAFNAFLQSLRRDNVIAINVILD